MFTLETFVPITEDEAECTVSINGAPYRFRVQSELEALGLEAITYCDISDDVRRLIVNSSYERDLVIQLCRLFKGESVTLPVEIEPHMR